MNILEMCDAGGATVPVEATAEDAIRTMLDRHVGAVAVLDDNKRIAGIFTERDVLRRLSLSSREPAQTPVRDVMTTPVEMATLDTTPGQALGTMIERHYRHLPIVDDDGRYLNAIRNVAGAH
jgi:CBS domain-containing protein